MEEPVTSVSTDKHEQNEIVDDEQDVSIAGTRDETSTENGPDNDKMLTKMNRLFCGEFQLFDQLPNANVKFCIISLICDGYLLASGCIYAVSRPLQIDINYEKFKNDMLCLCVLYVYEAMLAFTTNTTTLFRWNKFDFIAHHLATIIIVGSTCLLDSVLAVQTYTYTYNLVLLVTLNEFLQTLCALGVFKKRPQFSLYYTVVIVALLATAEFIESLKFWMYGRLLGTLCPCGSLLFLCSNLSYL